MKLYPQWLKFTLRAKLTVLIETLVVVLIVTTGLVTTMREKESLENELRKRGLAMAEELAKFSARPMLSYDLPTLRRFVNHFMDQDYVLYVSVLDPNGMVIMHNDLDEVGKISPEIQPFTDLAPGSPEFLQVHNMNAGESHYDIFFPIQLADTRLGTICLGYSCQAVQKEIASARRQVLLIGFLTIIAGGIAAYLLAAFISRPPAKWLSAIL